MWRYLAGGVSALLLVAAGLFWWQNRSAGQTGSIAPAPFAAEAQNQSEPLEAPPAASEKTREEKRFARYDKDKNGHVTRDEYLVMRHRAFEKLDANGDGHLSFDEYAIKTIKRFGEADKDKSGVLDAAEFATTRIIRKPSATPQCDCSAAVQAALAEREDN